MSNSSQETFTSKPPSSEALSNLIDAIKAAGNELAEARRLLDAEYVDMKQRLDTEYDQRAEQIREKAAQEIAAARAVLDEYKSELNSAAESGIRTLGELGSQSLTLTSKLSGELSEVEQARQRIDKELRRVNEVLTQLTADRQTWDLQTREVEVRHKEALLVLQQSLSDPKSRIATLESFSSNFLAAETRNSAILQEVQKTIQEQKQRIQNLEGSNKDSQSAIANLQNEIQELKTKLETGRTDHVKLEKIVEEHNGMLNEHDGRLQKIETKKFLGVF